MTTEHDTLLKIIELTRPGQTLGISDAIDLICDVWALATLSVKNAETMEDAQ